MVLYLIRNMQTGREYVGTTIRTTQARWRDHLSACFTKHRQSPLYSEMREFGVKSFEMVELEQVDDYDSLMARERAVILERRTLYPHGYNVVRGGRGNYGWVPSPDVRQRMSEGQRGRKLTPEHKAKLSAFFKGRPCPANRVARGTCWNKGLKLSEATKQKMSASRKGKPWSEKRRAYWESMTPEERAANSHAIKQGLHRERN